MTRLRRALSRSALLVLAVGILSLGGAAASAIAPASRSATAAPRPGIVWDPIPFGARRRTEMTAYVRRHYGSFMRPTWRLIHPRVIVIHYTETPDFSSTYNTFAADHGQHPPGPLASMPVSYRREERDRPQREPVEPFPPRGRAGAAPADT